MALSNSINRSTRKYCSPIFQFAVSTAFILSTRAVAAHDITSSSAFYPPTSHRSAPAIISSGGIASSSYHHHPCFLWRRWKSSNSIRTVTNMAATPSFSHLILESPSAEHNKDPIYDQVLDPIVFPRLVDNAKNEGRDKINVLELAAGCGVHTTHFVTSFLSANKDLGIEWHPSDPDAEARSSIDARVQRDGLDKYVAPANSWILGTSGGTACGDRNRDRGDAGMSQSGNEGSVADYEQHEDYFDLALCINMIHIAPWEATLGLMECAGKVLRKGGTLVCYGPYKVGGTAVESNLLFDVSLRSRNPEWGVRNLEDVIDAAKDVGLEFVQKEEMPANNLSVLFRKA